MRLSYPTALAASAVSYVVWHHLGSVPRGFGPAADGTRIGDWVDLVTPYAVLLPALLTLLAAGASARAWVGFLVGSWAYADGHGMHLSANSIGNSPGLVDPSGTAHLWDEYVGHALWYAGVATVVVVLASTTIAHPRPRHPAAWVLALLVGVTWGTNCVGGNLSGAGLVPALVAIGWGLRHRRDLSVLLSVAGAGAVVVLVGHLALGLG